jgi:hypothetical protein
LVHDPSGRVRPLVWCWDNLNIHLAPELADFAAENAAWLRVYQLPVADLDGLVRIVKREQDERQ